MTYTYWDGGEMPVPEGTLVDVIHRCGCKHYNVVAGQDEAEDWSHTEFEDGDDDFEPGDIIAYRISKESK